MEWTNSVSLQLIKLYREHECLWNPVHDDYKSKIKKLDAWYKICEVMKCDTGEVQKKMESLLTSFRRERQKQKTTVKTGSGADEIYKSTWYAFKDMLFLMDKLTPRATKNTRELLEESTKDQEEDATNDGIESAERTTPKRKSLFKSSTKTKRIAVNSGTSSATSRAEEAYKILEDTVANSSLRDDSTIYGEHVASKHRKYSVHTRSVVEHQIGHILFNADMGRYSQQTYTTVPTQHQFPHLLQQAH